MWSKQAVDLPERRHPTSQRPPSGYRRSWAPCPMGASSEAATPIRQCASGYALCASQNCRRHPTSRDTTPINGLACTSKRGLRAASSVGLVDDTRARQCSLRRWSSAHRRRSLTSGASARGAHLQRSRSSAALQIQRSISPQTATGGSTGGSTRPPPGNPVTTRPLTPTSGTISPTFARRSLRHLRSEPRFGCYVPEIRAVGDSGTQGARGIRRSVRWQSSRRRHAHSLSIRRAGHSPRRVQARARAPAKSLAEPCPCRTGCVRRSADRCRLPGSAPPGSLRVHRR